MPGDLDDNRTAELEAFLVLNASGLTPMRQFALLEPMGSATAVLAATDRELVELEGITGAHVDRLRQAQRDVSPKVLRDRCEGLGVHPVPYTWPEYPPLLNDTKDRTPLLFVEGDFEKADELSIAVVGTRKCSAYGRQMAQRLAGDLARRGFTIVSGLALGIDGEAHEAVLEAGGRTIGVMANGADITYPSQHKGLRERIAQSGAVVTEFGLGTEPLRERFPARNRLISGMSLGVLVVEAPVKSGALITARIAGEQGRDVFAVPADVTRPESRGCHALLKDGAHIVEFAEDVVEGLGIMLRAVPERQPVDTAGLPGDERAVMEGLSHEPKCVDEIVAACGLPASKVTSALMLLEMKGIVRRLPGSTFVRIA